MCGALFFMLDCSLFHSMLAFLCWSGLTLFGFIVCLWRFEFRSKHWVSLGWGMGTDENARKVSRLRIEFHVRKQTDYGRLQICLIKYFTGLSFEAHRVIGASMQMH